MKTLLFVIGMAVTAVSTVHARPAAVCFSETAPPPDSLIAACNQVIVSKPSNGELAHAYFMRAQGHAAKRENLLAIADFTRVLALMPGNISAVANRAVAYDSLRDYDHAIADDNQLIKIKPSLAVGYVNRGVVYADSGNQTLAIADFDHALALEPRLSGGILSNRGRSYVELHQYAHAIADEDAAIRLRSGKDAEAFGNRCYARAAANDDLDLALADCNRSLSLRPENLNALEKRALVFLRLHKLAEARRDFDLALQLDPARAFSLYGRGLVKIASQDTASGKADLERALAEEPQIRARFLAFGFS